jgi:16S rRNA (cytosine967-C5)-methyltransferase
MRMLVQQYDVHDAAKLAEANNRRPAHGIRINGDAAQAAAWFTDRLGVEAACSPLLPASFVRVGSNMQALLGSEWMRSGGGQVQDESAGLVVAMLDPQPGQAILDACAAPGGKTMYAAARMGGTVRFFFFC